MPTMPEGAGAIALAQKEGNMATADQDAERQVERLATVIRGFLENGCPLDDPLNSECGDPARHLAQEILERRVAWE